MALQPTLPMALESVGLAGLGPLPRRTEKHPGGSPGLFPAVEVAVGPQDWVSQPPETLPYE